MHWSSHDIWFAQTIEEHNWEEEKNKSHYDFLDDNFKLFQWNRIELLKRSIIKKITRWEWFIVPFDLEQNRNQIKKDMMKIKPKKRERRKIVKFLSIQRRGIKEWYLLELVHIGQKLVSYSSNDNNEKCRTF